MPLMSRTRTTLCGLLVLALLLCARAAFAHAVGLSTGDYSAHGSTLVAKLAFARNEIAQLVPDAERFRRGDAGGAEGALEFAILAEERCAAVEMRHLRAKVRAKDGAHIFR